MANTNTLHQIWAADRLQRRREASTIEKYLVRETETFRRLGRNESIVLGVDAPYGRGKSWFLDRLSQQLELSHPVARIINAWADDAGDEPLTAFMAAIDDALAPYLSKSTLLRDRMAAAKAAALPIMGKLISGAAIKALSKLAGEAIEDEIGNSIEEAVLDVRSSAKGPKQPAEAKQGAAAEAMEAAFNTLGKEIDSLVDRRGAAMLAAYRQRKHSRELFRRNMAELVASIDGSKGPGKAPLIVIVDELDRCRPDYALRMLEEIKHFFEVPGVVFVLGLHGGQLSKSIKAVYGAEFDSNDYLRRFFTRRYELNDHSIVDLAAATFNEWGLPEDKFQFPEPALPKDYQVTKPRLIGLILSQWQVTPRELTSVMDGLRLFVDGWEHDVPIEPITLLALLVHLVRGEKVDAAQIGSTSSFSFRGFAARTGGELEHTNFQPNQVLSSVPALMEFKLNRVPAERHGGDPARNYLIGWLGNELRLRAAKGPEPEQTFMTEYIPRLTELARFIDKASD